MRNAAQLADAPDDRRILEVVRSAPLLDTLSVYWGLGLTRFVGRPNPTAAAKQCREALRRSFRA